MLPFDYGDPYVEWNEEISARDSVHENEGAVMDVNELKAEVLKLLITEYDFDTEEAEEAVNRSAETDNPSLWHENAEPADLAKYLASDGDDD